MKNPSSKYKQKISSRIIDEDYLTMNSTFNDGCAMMCATLYQIFTMRYEFPR